MTALMTADAQTVDRLDFLTGPYLEQWSSLLAHGWSPANVLWKIEQAVADSPGLGLTFVECDAGCGLHVAGADPGSRLVLCDDCRDEAARQSEEFLVATLGKSGVADEWAADLRRRIAESS